MMVERDSRKDEAVVIMFILATSGLLAWAVLRPWVQGWVEVSLAKRRSRGSGMLSTDTWIYRLRESGEAIFRFRMVVEGLTSNSIHASSLYKYDLDSIVLILHV